MESLTWAAEDGRAPRLHTSSGCLFVCVAPESYRASPSREFCA